MPHIANSVMVHNYYENNLSKTLAHTHNTGVCVGGGVRGGVGVCPHQSINKLVKVLHCDLLEKVHVSKDINWS